MSGRDRDPKKWVLVPAWMLPSSVTSGKFLNLPESQFLPSEEAGFGTSVLRLFTWAPHWLLHLI